MIKPFLAALMFLTRIPAPNIQVSDTDWKKSAVYFPVVGLIIGTILAFAVLGFEKLFSPFVSAFLIVLLWIWITGGLHMDGWMDVADGFGSNKSREEMLAIMKDSRVGAMGVIAAICLIMGKWAAVYELLRLDLPMFLVICPFYARFLLMGAIKCWPYRSEGGLGEGLHTYVTLPVVIVNLILVAAATYALTGLYGMLLLIIAAIASSLFAIKMYKTLHMLTGDCYGALVEWSECVVLFLALAIWRFAG
ncbi:MAG: adenosylcobinamide-GDP ribazoletransferase [Ectobacillus sp.]